MNWVIYLAAGGAAKTYAAPSLPTLRKTVNMEERNGGTMPTDLVARSMASSMLVTAWTTRQGS